MDAGYQQHGPKVDQAPALIQDDCCDCDKNTRVLGCFAGFSALGGTAVTWLLSSATHPIVGGAVTLLTSVVGLAILSHLGENKTMDEEAKIAYILAGMAATSVVSALALSALGFSLSIPLSLLYTAVSLGSFFGSIALNDA